LGAIAGCDALIHLAAHPSPMNQPDTVVYTNNTVSSYNALSVSAALGIQRVCLASSINAIGGVYSREPRYDYFPLDEKHPTYAEDAYSLSKWVLEQQGDAFARRYASMRIASLRFHWMLETRERAEELTRSFEPGAIRHLWAYTLTRAASRACLLAVTADFTGHEVFYIAAPRTAAAQPSRELAAAHYPTTAIRGDLAGQAGFFDCGKAERLLGWRHED
jgi:UDP-glucose 4-epimerase